MRAWLEVACAGCGDVFGRRFYASANLSDGDGVPAHVDAIDYALGEVCARIDEDLARPRPLDAHQQCWRCSRVAEMAAAASSNEAAARRYHELTKCGGRLMGESYWLIRKLQEQIEDEKRKLGMEERVRLDCRREAAE